MGAREIPSLKFAHAAMVSLMVLLRMIVMSDNIASQNHWALNLNIISHIYTCMKPELYHRESTHIRIAPGRVRRGTANTSSVLI